MKIGNMTFPPDRGRRYTYWRNVLVGLDQGLGTFWGINCDETISSWVGRTHPDGWVAKLINWLFKDPNHCTRSIGH